jgi:hypothetical protein
MLVPPLSWCPTKHMRGMHFSPHLSFTVQVEREFSSSHDYTAPQQIGKMTSVKNHGRVTNQAGIQNVSGSINYYLSPSGPQIPRCNHGKKSSTNTVPCKQCKKPFSSSQALKQHLDSGIHEAKCTFCIKSFRDQPSLQQHIIAAHNFNCSSCNRRFKTQKALSQHTTDIHRRRPTS